MSKLTKLNLQKILTLELRLKNPQFHLESNGGLLSGSVISTTFKGKKDHVRQKMIWDALTRALGMGSTMQVGMLLAYTPEEWTVDLDV